VKMKGALGVKKFTECSWLGFKFLKSIFKKLELCEKSLLMLTYGRKFFDSSINYSSIKNYYGMKITKIYHFTGFLFTEFRGKWRFVGR